MKYFGFAFAAFIAAAPASIAATVDSAALPPPVAINGGVTSIDDIGYYAVSYRYFDGRTGAEPLGWDGDFQPDTGIAALPMGLQGGKNAFLLHPIWRGGTGDTNQTFCLTLPKATSIGLALSIGMRADAVGKSDGVTFRVRINGQTLLDQNKADGSWSDYDFDLTHYAGQTITLVFEADPGPKHDSSFDFGLWGDRRIVVRGAKTSVSGQIKLTLPPDLASQTSGWGGASPAVFTSDHRDKISSTLQAKPANLFSGMSFQELAQSGGQTQSIPFGAGGYLDLVAPDGSPVRSDSASVHVSVTQSVSGSNNVQRVSTYTIGNRTIKVNAVISRRDAGCIRMRVYSSDPYIAGIHSGDVGPTPMRRTIVVPYYGTVSFDPTSRLFSNVFFDYGLSHGSSESGKTMEYAPLTDGRRNTLDETIYYAVSPHIAEVLPTPINSPSPYRQAMGDVAVLDYWGGDAAKFSEFLKDLATYGLTHFLTIVHVWQHGGYDQQLPSVLPANEGIGGNDGLRTLTTAAKALGERVAMHENYVDFYPNGPLYTKDDIAQRPDGSLIPAWSFPGHVSFLMSPIYMHKYAALITPQVHEQLGTSASYLDVHSAIDPWSHTDALASRSGAGMFATCLSTTKSLWQFMRDTHGGPVLGEGNAHWYWSGMLDGVEAQFGQGVPGNAGETAPLLVDFDLLKIHPRQMNHGMGYVERWLKPESRDPLTQSQIDEYRMQEVAYGHSAFVATRDDTMALPFIWDESNLVIPVASRYASAKAQAIGYEVGGRILNTDDAIAAGSSFDRVRISYNNGLVVYANSRPSPWTVTNGDKQYILPQYGWLAAGPHFLAYSTSTGTFARSTDSIYVNARLIKAADLGYARPYVLTFQQSGPRTFDIALGFDVQRKIEPNEAVFCHIVDDKAMNTDGIVAQFGSGIAAAPDVWPVGDTKGGIVHVRLPETLADGSYDIRVGLYNPKLGGRIELTGNDDGALRYIVGTFNLGGGGSTITFTQQASPKPIAYGTQTAKRNFGCIATNGSVKMTRISPGVWKLTPMPRDTPFSVVLNGPQIDSSWRRITAIAIDKDGRNVGSAQVLPEMSGQSLLLADLPQGSVAYKLQNAAH